MILLPRILVTTDFSVPAQDDGHEFVVPDATA